MTLSLEVDLLHEPPDPDEDEDSPEAAVCANCGSNKITFDATAYWDEKQQQFEYDIFRDKVYCQFCDGKQHVDWVSI